MARIAFIGLGRMGLPMAKNLVAKGHQVAGYDVSEAGRAAAAETGLAIARSAAEASADADSVVTMVPAGADTLAVYEGSGVLASARPGTLFIDASSIDIASAKRAHALAAEAGMESLDAPVSGGIAGAQAGTLMFMVGGGEAAFRRAEPILAAMGKRIVHCGEAGAGQAVKMCNQLMAAVNMAGMAEAFVLAEKLGVDPKVLHGVVAASSGGSWVLSNYCPVPGLVQTSAAERNFAPGFTTDLMLKDLRIFQEAARNTGAASPVGAVATALYALFQANGNGSKDYSGIIQLIRGKVE